MENSNEKLAIQGHVVESIVVGKQGGPTECV